MISCCDFDFFSGKGKHNSFLDKFRLTGKGVAFAREAVFFGQVKQQSVLIACLPETTLPPEKNHPLLLIYMLLSYLTTFESQIHVNLMLHQWPS